MDVASPAHDNLHLEDFKFTDLKWAKSSRMSKRWLVFFVRIKVCPLRPLPPTQAQPCARAALSASPVDVLTEQAFVCCKWQILQG